MRLAADRRRMEAAERSLAQCVQTKLARRRTQFEHLSAKLSQLSPLLVLERGYAIVSNAGGVLTSAADAPARSRIHVRLSRGEVDAVVE